MSVFESLVVQAKSPFDLEQLADQFRRSQTDWSIPEAFFGILVCAAMADGQMQGAEQEAILHLASRSPALKALSLAELSQMNEVVNQRIVNRPQALQEACDTLPLEMGPCVYAHCVDILLADGQLLPMEATFLEELVPRLRVQPDVAQKIAEVMVMKAKY